MTDARWDEDARTVIDLLDYWTPLLLRAVVEAGVLEAIGDDRRAVVEVADETGVHAPTLARVLRALAGRGVVHEGPDGSYALAPIARVLLAEHPRSLRGRALFLGFNYHAWAGFMDTLRDGSVAFERHYGMKHFEWLAAHPDKNARFDAVMQRRTASLLKSSIPLVDRLPEQGTIIDVGGGNGTFLADVLASRPGLRGVVFDQPQVVSAAAAVFEAAGVAERAHAEGGDFFAAIPTGGDVYTLLSVLHDWDDNDAVRILKRVRAAMDPGTFLLIGEAILAGPNEWDPFKNLDLQMLVLFGGRERSEPEWRALVGQAGFRVDAVTPSPALGCIAATAV